MTKCVPKKALKSGWTRWQMPVMSGYKLQCCDCDLIHELEFRAVRIVEERGRGYKKAKILDTKTYRVEYRAKR